MALTMTQIKEICDYVASKSSNPDTYNSESNPMRLYYISVTDRGAKVYKKDDDIVAIFGKEPVPYTEDGVAKVYTASIVYDNTIPVNGLESVYWRGVGANLSVKTLIRNIGVFLGVNISANIDKENPVMYDEMVSICRSHIDDINKIPYYICQTSSTTYHTYVPLDILVDMAIYLRESGIFNTSKNLLNNDDMFFGEINSQAKLTANKDLLKPLSYFYGIQSKDDFIKNFKTFYDILETDTNKLLTLEGMLEAYGDQINFNNLIIASMGSGTNLVQIIFRNMPTSCFFTVYSQYTNDPQTLRNGTSTNLIIWNTVEDFVFTTYSITYNIPNQEFTTQVSVSEYTKDTYYNLSLSSFLYSNVLFNKSLKPYCNGFMRSVNTYPEWRPVERYDRLSDNVFYTPKFTGLNTIRRYKTLLYFNLLENNIDITEHDFSFVCAPGNNKYYVYVFKDVEEIKCSMMATLCNCSYANGVIASQRQTYSSQWVDVAKLYRYSTNWIYNSNIRNAVITFNKNVDFYRYIFTYNSTNETYTLTETETDNLNTYTVEPIPNSGTTDVRCQCCNLGEILEFAEAEGYTGIELIPNSTYPTTIIDKPTFRSLYNRRSYVDIHQPVIIDDIVQADQISATTWVNCSVSKTPPATQADSEDWDIDDATPEDQEKIADDIDASSNDDDSDDSDEDSSGGEPDGGDPTKIVDADLVPNGLVGCLKQYKLNTSQNIAFATGLNSLDFSDVIQALIYGNPVNGVISYATTYDGLWNSENATEQQIILWNNSLDDGSNPCMGYRVAKSCKEIDCGTIDFSTNTDIQDMMQDNYTDITDCYLQIMLPFVGLVDLNIRDFYNNKLHLIARVDSLTGAIVYNLFNSFDGEEYLVTSVSGNCQAQLPLKSSDMSQLIRNIGNSALAVGGSIVGGLV